MVLKKRHLLSEERLLTQQHKYGSQTHQPQELLLYNDGSHEDVLPCFAFPASPPLPASSPLRPASPQHDAHLRFDVCVSSLMHLAKTKALSEAMSLHACIVDHCYDRSRLIGNLLVQMYGQCDGVDDALCVFFNMRQKNFFTWNAIISACAYAGLYQQALDIFYQMRKDGLMPNKFVFASIINACSNRQVALHEQKSIHSLIKKCGLECDVVVGTALLNMYGKCGSMDDVKEMFLKLQERDLVTWNAMIATYTQHEQEGEALYLYQQMLQEGSLPDEFTLGSVIDAHVTHGALLPGKFLHSCIVAGGLNHDVVLSTALITLYGKFDCLEAHAAIDEGRRMHTLIVCYGIKVDINLGNALINMYGKCSSLVDAHKAFIWMSEQDIISWNAVLGVYAQNGQVKSSLSLFDQMCDGGVTPNDVTFINILSACSHAGLVNQGLQCFVSIGEDHGVIPTVDHFNCVIDLLVRAGQLDEAEYFLNNMWIEPTSISWTALLGACRVEGDLHRGDRIAKHVFKLEPNNFAHHITLANIYAAVYPPKMLRLSLAG